MYKANLAPLKLVRVATSIFAGIAGLVCAFFAFAGYSSLSELSTMGKSTLQHFRQMAVLVEAQTAKFGRFPQGEELIQLTQGSEIGNFSYNVHIDTDHCGVSPKWENFVKKEGDAFVLSYWNGDWFECYSFPSAKTTIRTVAIREDYDAEYRIIGGFGLIALCLFIFSWLIWPRGKLGSE
jgi:hypothetical protein